MSRWRISRWSVPLLCLIFVCTLSGVSFAQRGTLSGKVTDQESGDPLPGANVSVTATGVQTGAASGTDGTFEVRNLAAGTYTVTVSFIGYEQQVLTATIAAGQTTTLDVALRLTGLELNPIFISASRRAEKTLDAPASITVLEPRELVAQVATSSASVLKNVTGVDVSETGIDRREMVLRGFNNAFSGAAYILTDYREAAVPSLDVNIHSIMPNMAIDLEKVEIVRGPGSALYGAGVDAGVIHYITKDPFRYPGTTLSVTGGNRSSVAGHLRHAGSFSSKVGYKVTGQYARADDWDYDVNDPLDAAQLINPITGDTTFFNRDYEKVNVNGLLQFQLAENTSLSFNGGYSALTATVLSGIGTVQADGYGYIYGQARLQAGNFFAQAYLNKNNVGDSFVYGQTQPDGERLELTDDSEVINLQAQYDLELANGREQLIIGSDFERVNPKTGGTILGRNEADAEVTEFGVYVQSTTRLSSHFDLTAALRLDKNNIDENVQLSPRAALVYKPTPAHSFRTTYNRAYDLPGTNSLFLDIIGREVPLTPDKTIIQRGRGSKNGFTYETATQGGVTTASGLLPVDGIWGQNVFQYAGAGIPTQNVPLAAVYGILYSQLAAIPIDQIQALLMSQGIILPDQVVEQFIILLSPVPVVPGVPTTVPQGLGTSVLEAEPEEIKPLESTITNTIEIGYKGVVNDRFLIAIDGYYTNKKNFVSGVTQATPLSGFIDISSELTPSLAAAIAANPILGPALGQAGLTPEQVAALLVSLGGDQLNSLPVGVVQPDQNMAPGEIVGAYRNFGDVDLWGIDASIQVIVNPQLSLFANASYVSSDFFTNEDLGEANPALFLALNATQTKFKLGFNYTVRNGFSFNAAGRYTKAFPVASGPYVGGLPIPVEGDIGGLEDFFLLDIGAGYDFGRYAPGLRLDFSIQNVLDEVHREFIGAPKLGRLGLMRLTYSM